MDSNFTKRKAIGWLSLSHLVCDIYGGFLNPIMPFIAAKLGFTMAIATVIISIAQICSNMLQPIFGFFADNMLKRFFIFWGLILASVFIPLAPAAPNITILTLCMIIGCLGGSFFHPQSLGFIKRFSGENYSDNMGFFVSMGSLGFAFGPLLAAYITQYAGLAKISYTSILGLSLAGLMFLCVPKISLTDSVLEHKKFINSFKEILQNKQIDLLLIVAMMKSLITNSSCILLPFLWRDMGCKPSYIGFALFLFIFAGALGSFISPKLEKIIGTKIVIYISMCATLPMMFGFAFTYKSYPSLSLAIFALIGFTTMLAQPVIIVLGQKILPQYKSIIAGFINGFCWGTVALALSVLGAIAQFYGIINVLLVLSVLPVIASHFVKNINDKNITQ
ncbi:MAG: MFS transporter [bacterium]|nr:MFS transporter [bacterium]